MQGESFKGGVCRDIVLRVEFSGRVSGWSLQGGSFKGGVCRERVSRVEFSGTVLRVKFASILLFFGST